MSGHFGVQHNCARLIRQYACRPPFLGFRIREGPDKTFFFSSATLLFRFSESPFEDLLVLLTSYARMPLFVTFVSSVWLTATVPYSLFQWRSLYPTIFNC